MKCPWFKFYATDFLTGGKASEMTSAEVGLYIRVLSWSWVNGPVPADPVRINRIFGGPDDDQRELWTTVIACFENADVEGFVVNVRLEAERAEAEDRFAKARKGGKARASKAQAEPKLSGSSAQALLPASDPDSDSSSLSGSGSEKKKGRPKPETWQEVLRRPELETLGGVLYAPAWDRWVAHCQEPGTKAKLPTGTRAAAIFNQHVRDIPLAVRAIDAAIMGDWKAPSTEYVKDKQQNNRPAPGESHTRAMLRGLAEKRGLV